MMSFLSLFQQFIVLAPPVLLAITVHEAAHAGMARYCGDPTAAQLGRVSFNPLRHIDPIGTVLIPALLWFTTDFLFGWAKPVPVNWQRLRHPRRDMAWVAAAGPFSNLFMAITWLVIAHIGLSLAFAPAWLIDMTRAGVLVNLVLMAINLIPIPPLDGGRILSALLPQSFSPTFRFLEPYGMVFALLLFASGLLSWFLPPVLISILNTWPAPADIQALFAH